MSAFVEYSSEVFFTFGALTGNSDSKTPQEIQLEMQEEERILGGMSERQRRSYLRKMQRGDVEEAKVLANKVDDGGWSDNEEDDDESQEQLETALDSLDEEEEQ